MRKGEVVTFSDGKLTGVLSTIHNSSMTTISRRSRSAVRGVETVNKPNMIVEYNKYMGGVDIADQLVTYYGFSHYSRKWWKRAFFHLIDVCMVNSYILYCSANQKKITHLDFVLAVARQFVEAHQHTPSLHTASPDQPIRFIGRDHFPEPSRKRDCCVCSKRPLHRKASSYQCSKCKVSLCIHPCFKHYHTPGNYKL